MKKLNETKSGKPDTKATGTKPITKINRTLSKPKKKSTKTIIKPANPKPEQSNLIVNEPIIPDDLKILCNNCKQYTPFLNIKEENNKIYIKTDCKFCKNNDSFPIKDYINELVSMSKETKACQKKQSHLFTKAIASCNGEYLCEECLENLKNSNKKGFKYYILKEEEEFFCEKHDKVYIYYCKNCDQHFCKGCNPDMLKHKKNEHFILNLIELKQNFNTRVYEGKLKSFENYFKKEISKCKDNLIKYLKNIITSVENTYNLFYRRNSLLVKLAKIIKNNYLQNFETSSYNDILNVYQMTAFIDDIKHKNFSKEMENIKDFDEFAKAYKKFVNFLEGDITCKNNFSDSDILDFVEKSRLTHYLSDSGKINKAELLYKATRDGDGINNFYENIQGKKPIVVLMLTKKNRKFGAFTNQSFPWVYNYIEQFQNISDKDAFLFSTDKDKKYIVNLPDYALNCKFKTLMMFGSVNGQDGLIIEPGFLRHSNCLEDHTKRVYDVDSLYELTGENIFGLKEMEVYQVCFGEKEDNTIEEEKNESFKEDKCEEENKEK